jgi:hypothetical protein
MGGTAGPGCLHQYRIPPAAGLQSACFPAPGNLLQFSILRQKHRFAFFGFQAAAQDVAQLGYGAAGARGLFVNQRTDGVKGIENKVRVDVCA